MCSAGCCVCCCARYQGHVSAALILGGVDLNGPHLFTVRTLLLHFLPLIYGVGFIISEKLYMVVGFLSILRENLQWLPHQPRWSLQHPINTWLAHFVGLCVNVILIYCQLFLIHWLNPCEDTKRVTYTLLSTEC